MKPGFIVALGLIVMLFKTASANEKLSNPDVVLPQDLTTPLDLAPFEVREHCFDTHSNPPIVQFGRFMRFATFDHYWNAKVFVVTIIKDNTQFVAQFVQGATGTVAMFFEKRGSTVIVFTNEEQAKRMKELLPPEYFNAEGQLEMKNFSKCAPDQPA